MAKKYFFFNLVMTCLTSSLPCHTNATQIDIRYLPTYTLASPTVLLLIATWPPLQPSWLWCAILYAMSLVAYAYSLCAMSIDVCSLVTSMYVRRPCRRWYTIIRPPEEADPTLLTPCSFCAMIIWVEDYQSLPIAMASLPNLTISYARHARPIGVLGLVVWCITKLYHSLPSEEHKAIMFLILACL